MVAYSFKKQFAEPIDLGTKTHTIRANGKRRHARPGETLQLYMSMRTKQCRKLKETPCTASAQVRLYLAAGRFRIVLDGAVLDVPQSEAFARRDGFPSLRDMAAYWQKEHPALDVFQGTVTSWAEGGCFT